MSSSIGKWDKRINEQLAKEIRGKGRFLGILTEYNAWEATLEEIELYNECPV